MPTERPVLVATDLTDASLPALVRGKAHADAAGVPLHVCHIVHDVVRYHPLLPEPGANELVLGANLMKRAAECVSDQVERTLGLAPSGFRIEVEVGVAEEEIVRIAENLHASLIVVGGAPREGARKVLGHVAERVVRYAHAPVLVAREEKPGNKVLVATDFTEGSQATLALARKLGAHSDVTLVHVFEPLSSALSSALAPLGDAWMPPPKAAVDELSALGRSMLENLAKEHGVAHWEQLQGDPADSIVRRAEELGADTIVLGSRGRRGLSRLVLGSVAERVVRHARASVLIARE